jgi:hypothetical protein
LVPRFISSGIIFADGDELTNASDILRVGEHRPIGGLFRINLHATYSQAPMSEVASPSGKDVRCPTERK